MAKSEGFVYRGRERTTEDITRRARQSSGSYDSFISSDFPQLKVKEGDNTYRILPATWLENPKLLEKWGDSWDIQVWVHGNIGPDRGTFICLDKMLGEPCPCCEARAEADDEDERDALKPFKKIICWAIDRSNEKAGPQVWTMPPKKVYNEVMNRAVDKKTNTPVLLDDPEQGYDIMFNRTGTGMTTTNYSQFDIDRDPSPIHQNEKLQERWLQFVIDNPLPEILCYHEYDYVKKVLSGRARKKPEVDEDDTSSRRRSNGSDHSQEEGTTRRRVAREPEDEGTEATTSRRASRTDANDESSNETSTRRRTRSEDEQAGGKDEDIPFERPARRRSEEATEEAEARPSRRVSATKDEEASDDVKGIEEPSRAARSSLSRLRERVRE